MLKKNRFLRSLLIFLFLTSLLGLSVMALPETQTSEDAIIAESETAAEETPEVEATLLRAEALPEREGLRPEAAGEGRHQKIARQIPSHLQGHQDVSMPPIYTKVQMKQAYVQANADRKKNLYSERFRYDKCIRDLCTL